MEPEKRKLRREEEILETALAAAGAALFVSGLKKLLPCILKQWPVASVVTPSLLLFLLLNLIIASIVVISVHPKCGTESKCKSPTDGVKRKKKSRQRGRRSSSPASTMEKKQMEFVELGGDEGEEDGDAEELNARVEAFITAFRRQLRVDSFSSGGIHHRTSYAGTPSCLVDHECY
ncbi:uncharacterized protein LOC103719250 [Phoenix dactylifera]|uniref:Uncharacterized protein LOC103719250 n=1 Tax=Phoenix dactylifera TaxID=42345 RepID=A0A8B7CUC8_PHODC|nr:uncharacterized protein LOC103719250 [Phoenix dactylifera]